jgi:hypothetical protein
MAEHAMVGALLNIDIEAILSLLRMRCEGEAGAREGGIDYGVHAIPLPYGPWVR